MQSIVQNRLPETQNNPNVVIPNFIDDLAGTSPTAALKGDIISVSTSGAQKKQSFILKVLATCKARGYVYRLTIIGDGQDRDALEHSAHELGLAEQVTFLGFKPNPLDYISSHKVYAHACTYGKHAHYLDGSVIDGAADFSSTGRRCPGSIHRW